MVFIALAFYFFLACTIIGLALFPAGRYALARRIDRTMARFTALFRVWSTIGGREATNLRTTSSNIVLLFCQFVRKNAKVVATALTIAVVPTLLALTFGRHIVLAGFEDAGHNVNLQVAELLKGEQLVPPPALPPELFTTQEALQDHPLLGTASRNWTLLQGTYAQRLLSVFKIMKEKYGYDMAILEGYRSPERQNMLAAMGKQVTSAAAFQSYHQFGLAADIAFLREGKLVISERDPWAMEGYRHYGEIAESVGLTWGGRWKMMDFGHTELRVAGVIKK